MNEIARAILNENRFAVLSTVREDGSPWATPIHYAYDDDKIYWFSNEDAVHSINITRNDSVFITIFDSLQKGEAPGEHGAVYVSTKASLLRGGDEDKARELFNNRYPLNKSSKHGDWSAFSAPFGTINPAKTMNDRIYYKYSGDFS